jgi:hypothetical protein
MKAVLIQYNMSSLQCQVFFVHFQHFYNRDKKNHHDACALQYSFSLCIIFNLVSLLICSNFAIP